MEDNLEIIQEQKNLEQNRKLFKKYLIFFVVVFAIAGSYFWGFSRGKNAPASKNNKELSINQVIVENKLPDDSKKIDFSLFWKVWDILKEKHINRDSLDAQTLVYGAINGLIRATGDPYSYFFSPEEKKAFSEDLEGSFEGIGAELGVKDNILTVIAPLEDSPAQKAGLRPGDKILKIDGKIAADMTIDEAVRLIRGEKGTEVKLTILGNGEEDTREVSIIRDTIEVKSVKLEFKENNVAYLKITKFGENTDREFNTAVGKIISQGSKGLILDLRNDPGGLLDKCVDIASRMIPKGKIVVTEENSSGQKDNLYTSGGDRLSSLPTVVLINEGSASASEILAGALRDDQGITLIGKKSFGKGTVQQLIDLSDGSSVKVTVAKWLTPGGDYIMEKGINPDIEVDLTLDDYKNNRDPQLDKAMEVIKEKIQ